MTIIFIVAAVVGFAAGSIFGWYRGIELSGIMQSVATISAASVTSNFARQQFMHADSGHAREAVLLQIKILGQVEQLAPDRSSESQLGLAYTRLAMVEEAAGQTESERNAQEKAREWFKRSNPRQDLTDDQMKNAVKKMDEAFDRL